MSIPEGDKMVRFIMVLAVICILAALVLGVTYNTTRPLIAAQKEKEKKLALERVLPGADEYKQGLLGDRQFYIGYKDSGQIGYIIYAEADGYAGKIEMLVGIGGKGHITGIEILSQTETPGLGARCVEVKYGEEEPWFLRQFKGKHHSELELKNIEAITGATITTETIVNAAKEAVADFLDKITAKN